MYTYNNNSQIYYAPLFRFGWPGPVDPARGVSKKNKSWRQPISINKIYTFNILLEILDLDLTRLNTNNMLGSVITFYEKSNKNLTEFFL